MRLDSGGLLFDNSQGAYTISSQTPNAVPSPNKNELIVTVAGTANQNALTISAGLSAGRKQQCHQGRTGRVGGWRAE
jgi:hypothetical protein